METLNVTGLHVFYFPHFSALTNAHNLISRQVITSEKQVVYFGFFKDDNFHLDKWSKGVLMFGWIHGIFLANMGFIIDFKIIVDIVDIVEIDEI